MNEERELLSAESADKLLACADGTAALLYIYIARSGGLSVTGAARVLKRSEAEVALAADTLRRLGLLEPLQVPLPDRELPEYTAGDIARRSAEDSGFSAVVREAEQTLGRVLSSNDLRLLFGLYDHLGLPADVLMLLLHHCVEEYQARNGAGRMPTMRFVEKEGWYWAEQEVLNLDAADALLRRKRERRETAARVQEVLQIRGRELTPTERRYVEDWIALGFGPEALAIAYDRTVSSTGRLAWKYMDRIIRSWDEKHLHTPEEIEAKDARRAPTRRQEGPALRDDDEKLEQMRRMLEHMKQKED